MPVCDVCSSPLNPSDGYALTTREVAGNDNYWTYMLGRHSFDEELLAMYVQQQAMQRSGWLVCETCSNQFSFDRTRARDFATRMADPPGSGPASVSEVAGAAARAWQRKKGTRPSWAR